MKLGVIVFFVILILVTCLDFADFSINAGNILRFVDLPSLIIVLGPTIVFAIGSYSWGTYVKTFSIPFGNPENNEQSELVEVNKCLNFLGNMSVVMGIIGTFIGVILLLNFLKQGVDLSRAIAIAVVTLFYGFLFKALCMFASSKVDKYIK
jgi:flagellar motor component MotA